MKHHTVPNYIHNLVRVSIILFDVIFGRKSLRFLFKINLSLNLAKFFNDNISTATTTTIKEYREELRIRNSVGFANSSVFFLHVCFSHQFIYWIRTSKFCIFIDYWYWTCLDYIVTYHALCDSLAREINKNSNPLWQGHFIFHLKWVFLYEIEPHGNE